MGPSHAAVWISALVSSVFFMGCKEIVAPPCTCPWSAKESQLWCLEYSLPFFFADFGVICPISNSFFSPHSSACVVFLPFLKCVVPEVSPALLMGSAVAVVRPLWSQLEPTGTGCAWHGTDPGLFSQRLLQPSHTNTLPPTPSHLLKTKDRDATVFLTTCPTA